METVGVFEAKTNLSALLERVAAGESFTISKRGVPIAVISPTDGESELLAKRKAAIEAIKKFRRGKSLGKITTKELINSGRKY